MRTGLEYRCLYLPIAKYDQNLVFQKKKTSEIHANWSTFYMSARKDEDMLGTTFASCFSAFVELSPMFLQSSTLTGE